MRFNTTIMKSFIIILLGWISALSVWGQDSLSTYLSIASKQNPVLLQKYAEYEAALRKVPQVGSLPDPELSMGVFLSPMEVVNGKQVADLRLMQMFPWFGVLRNAKDEMSLMAKARYESMRDAKLQLFFEMQQTWYQLIQNKVLIRLTEENVTNLQTIESLTIAQFKTPSLGNSPSATAPKVSSAASGNSTASPTSMQTMDGSATAPSAPAMSGSSAMSSSPMGSSAATIGLTDIYTIQMELGELTNSLNLLRDKQQTLQARFNSYLNRNYQSTLTLPDSMMVSNLPPDAINLRDSMLHNNPMVTMLQYEGQSVEARRQMVSRMGYPMVGVGLNYSVINKNEMISSSMNGKDMVMPMVTVTLPIYRRKYKAMQQEADLLKDANKYNLQATANDLQNNYSQAMELFNDSQRRMQLYDNQTNLAKQSYRLMLKRLEVSSSGLSDLLRINQQLIDYQSKHLQAVTDYNTSVAWLQRLGGEEVPEEQSTKVT
jgi:outer membrane protein TolC